MGQFEKSNTDSTRSCGEKGPAVIQTKGKK